jgi:hypothetical protein
MLVDYKLQLKTLDWQYKRSVILQRDNFKCSRCSNKNIIEKSDCYMGQILFWYEPFEISRDETHFIDNIPQFTVTTGSCSRNKAIEFVKGAITPRDYFLKSEIQKKFLFLVFNNSHEPIGIVATPKTSQWDTYVGWSERLASKQEIINSLGTMEWILLLPLQVHHNYYINNLYAWEYPDDCYVTYCNTCHKDQHIEGQKIPVYHSLNNKSIVRMV